MSNDLLNGIISDIEKQIDTLDTTPETENV
jgi:hypothetical protein